MTRIFGHYVAAETLILICLECLVCFITICVLLMQPGTFETELSRSAVSIAAVLAAGFGVSASALGLYQQGALLRTRPIAGSAALAGGIVVLMALAAHGWPETGTAAAKPIDWSIYLRILAGWTIGLAVSRCGFFLALRYGLLARPIVVVDLAAGKGRALQILDGGASGLFRVAAVMAPSDAAEFREEAQPQIWGVVITAAAAAGGLSLAHKLRWKANGLRVLTEGEFREQHTRRVDTDSLAEDWLVSAEGAFPGLLTRLLRRGMDVLISLALLLFTLPLMLLTALLIKLDSAGPVFYCQERVGAMGVPFRLIKFRSMRTDAEAASGPCWATTRDSRITAVGGFIRRTRIDELPQLLNVVFGDMSFIGPRPERPHFVAELAKAIPHYNDRSWVTPGLTGWAQVNFPYGASIEDARIKLSYDLYYVRHRSFFLDLLILIATIRVVLFQEGSR